MIELNKIYNEDCLEGMKRIPDHSVDCIICDLPYGTTSNPWDSIIPLDALWEQYKRVLRGGGAAILFAQIPFSIVLGSSNLAWLRYEWVWEKTTPTGFLNAKKMPMKTHENILVFYESLPTYNPQMRHVQECTGNRKQMARSRIHSDNYGTYDKPTYYKFDGERYPNDIITYKRDFGKKNNGRIHPTQKPVDLIAYLVRTYTNEGETILDNCMGSGTTAIACIREKRNFIGFELNKEYYEKACKRIEAEQQQLTLF